MDLDFEIEACLQPGPGLAEALDAAGIDGRARVPDAAAFDDEGA